MTLSRRANDGMRPGVAPGRGGGLPGRAWDSAGALCGARTRSLHLERVARSPVTPTEHACVAQDSNPDPRFLEDRRAVCCPGDAWCRPEVSNPFHTRVKAECAEGANGRDYKSAGRWTAKVRFEGDADQAGEPEPDVPGEYAEVCLLGSAARHAGLAVSGCGSGMGAAIRRQMRLDAVRRRDRALTQML